MSALVIAGDTSGTITIEAPAVAGTNTITLPASTGTIVTDTGAQTIQFSAGTAAAPSVTTTGDTNTGMFFPAADTIAFAEGGAEAMRINSSGELLMNGQYGGYDSNSTGAITLNANASDGVVNFKKGIVFSSDGGAPQNVWAHAGITSTGSAGFNGNLLFGTDGTGTQSGTITERMRIDSGGSLLVGTTTAQSGLNMVLQHGSSGAGAGLATVTTTTGAVNAISFQNPNGQIGRVQVNLTTTTYVTSSDYRLKENIVPMTGALDKVSKLKPVTYTWKTDGTSGQGFIAHELQEFYPEAIAGTKDEVDEDGKPVHQGVDTSFLVATLTAAIQEQQALITSLTTRIEALEAK
jgi:hypothetical protein